MLLTFYYTLTILYMKGTLVVNGLIVKYYLREIIIFIGSYQKL